MNVKDDQKTRGRKKTAAQRLTADRVAAVQAEFSNEMRKVLQSAVKRAKKNNDSFMGVDALLKALLENKDVAGALSEAGRHIPANQRYPPELTRTNCPPLPLIEEQNCLSCLPSCKMQTDSTGSIAGTSKAQLESALDEVRGSTGGRVDTDTGDQKFEALLKYGTDLTAKAAQLDPIIGRDEEIRRVVRILCRRTKNNPVLIGDPGKLPSLHPSLPVHPHARPEKQEEGGKRRTSHD